MLFAASAEMSLVVKFAAFLNVVNFRSTNPVLVGNISKLNVQPVRGLRISDAADRLSVMSLLENVETPVYFSLQHAAVFHVVRECGISGQKSECAALHRDVDMRSASSLYIRFAIIVVVVVASVVI